jgi:hypothetical protein
LAITPTAHQSKVRRGDDISRRFPTFPTWSKATLHLTAFCICSLQQSYFPLFELLPIDQSSKTTAINKLKLLITVPIRFFSVEPASFRGCYEGAEIAQVDLKW